MKRIAIIAFLVLILMGINKHDLYATEEYGTFFIGAKAWGVLWDSAYMKAYEKNNNFLNLILAPMITMTAGVYFNSSIHVDPGMGILGGPMIGYQTPNKKWSFSLAAMWFSYFEQKTHVKSLIGSAFVNPAYIPTVVKIKVERNEIDFAPSYAVMDYIKIFIGYKFQRFCATKTETGGSIVNSDFDIILHNVSPGLAFSMPLNQYFAFGIQAGGILVIPHDIVKGRNTSGFVTNERNNQLGYGLNGEASISANIGRVFILQLGYRAQVFWQKIIISGRGYMAPDIFHGIILSTLFYF